VSTDGFENYKELILDEIKTLKDDFKTFRKDTEDKVNNMQVVLAVLNTKLMTMSAISSAIVGSVVAFVMNKVLG
jgi:hypothetical protein